MNLNVKLNLQSKTSLMFRQSLPFAWEPNQYEVNLLLFRVKPIDQGRMKLPFLRMKNRKKYKKNKVRLLSK